MPPHPLVRGGEGTLACGYRGWGVPIPTRGHTLWCSIYISTLCVAPFGLLGIAAVIFDLFESAVAPFGLHKSAVTTFGLLKS